MAERNDLQRRHSQEVVIKTNSVHCSPHQHQPYFLPGFTCFCDCPLQFSPSSKTNSRCSSAVSITFTTIPQVSFLLIPAHVLRSCSVLDEFAMRTIISPIVPQALLLKPPTSTMPMCINASKTWIRRT